MSQCWQGRVIMEKITRRAFVIDSSKALGAIIGTASIGLPVITSGTAAASDIRFVESRCVSKGKKILIAYESRYGSTSEVAQHMAMVLCKKGACVDVRHIASIEDQLPTYDGAIIGSAVKSASWHPGAIEFVDQHQEVFSRIPVVYFLTCLALYHNTPHTRQVAKSYFDPVLTAVPQVRPKIMQAFAGKLDYSHMNLMMRVVMKSKMKQQKVPEGDFRDYEKIGAWAKDRAWPMLAGSASSL